MKEEEQGEIVPPINIVEGELVEVTGDVETVAIFAETIPSWIAVADQWGCQEIFLYCAREQEGYLEGLGLVSRVTRIRAISGMKGKDWMRENLPITLIQGSSKFGKDILEGLKSWGISEKDRIALVVTDRIRNLPLRLKIRKFIHTDFGGISTNKFSLGLSEGWQSNENFQDTMLPNIVRRLTRLANVTEPGKSFTPTSKKNIDDLHDYTPTLQQLVDSKFTLPNVICGSKWVQRKLTLEEIATAMDFPVGVVKGLSKRFENKNEVKMNLWAQVPPTKPIQWLGKILNDHFLQKNLRKEVGPVEGKATSQQGIDYSDEEIYLKIQQTKAVKNDDASADFSIWNRKASDTSFIGDTDRWKIVAGSSEELDGVEEKRVRCFDGLRGLQLRWHKWKVRRSFIKYLRRRYTTQDFVSFLGRRRKGLLSTDLGRDLVAGKLALDKEEAASFWEWDEGSYPFFWRWPKGVRLDMRDGTILWKTGPLPTSVDRQMVSSDKTTAARVEEKIDKVRSKDYIGPGWIVSITHFFDVPKGEDDIRIVYDLTRSGLNGVLWVPSFWMPSISHVLDCATHQSWFCDVDVGEMFLNFPLDLSIRPFCGVDLSWKLKKKGVLWERWNRMTMGMRPSPWVCTRLLAWMMEVVKGEPKAMNNPFRWDKVVLNCPGMKDYDPSMPRLYKWNEVLNQIAADIRWFMDDFRICGGNEEVVLQATRRLESIMAYLGLQDATRKRRPHGQHVGEWTGAISVAVEGVGLFVTISEKKWMRGKELVKSLLDKFETPDDRPLLSHKELERKTGFLVHLSMTYSDMKPFIRGLYLTMNSWRRGRDSNGWKAAKANFWNWVQHARRDGREDVMEEDGLDEEAPMDVKAAPLLYSHLSVLSEMMAGDLPALKLVRANKSVVEVGYVFGDASGEGFGASRNGAPKRVKYRYGVWGPEEVDDTSNCKEFKNLVKEVVKMGENGELEGREVFVFTDNSVSEAIATKGSSSSPHLFDLVVRLFMLNMTHKCKLQFIHVAGTRMIAQGTDGLSRGNLLEGVMRGQSILDFVPIHLGALDRSEELVKNIRNFAEGAFHKHMEVLTPDDWFWRGHDLCGMEQNIDGVWMPKHQSGTMLWVPPPAVATFAVDELRQARQKRQASFHILIVPRLMTLEWKKHTLKGADLVVDLPLTLEHWGANMYEPLTLALFFPYLSQRPWELRKTPILVDVERTLSNLFKTDESAGWSLLSELSKLAKQWTTMSVHQLRGVLSRRWEDAFSSE